MPKRCSPALNSKTNQQNEVDLGLIKLTDTLQTWQALSQQESFTSLANKAFKKVFVTEVEALSGHLLPLQAGLKWSSVSSPNDFKVLVYAITVKESTLEVKTSVFYKGLTAGCSCADDPTPLNEQVEHCELLFSIDKRSGLTEVQILED